MSDYNDSNWLSGAECAKEVVRRDIMGGAWDGPNEDGDRHVFHKEAKRICRDVCPVREFCLRDAMKDEEAQGLRGGYEFDGGKVPVGIAREIVENFDVTVSPWQSLGRPKKPSSGKSTYL